jgi:Polyketide cyclase / dehydrase and lipid transport
VAVEGVRQSGKGRVVLSSQWHKLYTATVDAPPAALFRLLSDMPNYSEWLPGSGQFGRTTDVDPYPVRLGTRYHDGKPGESGTSWWGTVTGFQPSGSIDFNHTITVKQLRATVDVHIHYSFEPDGENEQRTRVNRWLLLDIVMPLALRPLKPLITSAFDKENVRTIAAVKKYAEDHRDLDPVQHPSPPSG